MIQSRILQADGSDLAFKQTQVWISYAWTVILFRMGLCTVLPVHSERILVVSNGTFTIATYMLKIRSFFDFGPPWSSFSAGWAVVSSLMCFLQRANMLCMFAHKQDWGSSERLSDSCIVFLHSFTCLKWERKMPLGMSLREGDLPPPLFFSGYMGSFFRSTYASVQFTTFKRRWLL